MVIYHIHSSDALLKLFSAGSHAKNAVVMSNGKLDWSKPDSWTGMLDRSPCGTGDAIFLIS